MPTISHNMTSAEARKRRVRGKLHGTAERPRVTVYRSNRFIYGQAIDDAAGKTLASARSLATDAGTKSEQANAVGATVAAEMKKQGITKAIFDRGSYNYHGRMKAVAEALRTAGITV